VQQTLAVKKNVSYERILRRLNTESRTYDHYPKTGLLLSQEEKAQLNAQNQKIA